MAGLERRKVIALAIAVALACALPFVLGNYRVFQLTLVLAYSIALLGGIDSPGGAVLGGFIVGVLENVVGAYVGTELKLTVALIVIVAVLVVRPSGLFGKVHVTRVLRWKRPPPR